MQQLHGLIANQIAIATSATTIAAHATGVTCFELPLRGELLAAWLNSLSIWPPSAAEPSVLQNKQLRIYRNTARTLSQSDAPARSPSAFDDAGCAGLTGSDAGKLSIRPVSSFAWVSRSAKAASRGLAACLSCAAGSNFSAISGLHWKTTRPQSGRSQRVERNVIQAAQERSSVRTDLFAASARKGRRAGFLCRMVNIAQTGAATSGRLDLR